MKVDFSPPVIWVSIDNANEKDLRDFNHWLITQDIFPAVLGGSSGPNYSHLAYTVENAEKIKQYWASRKV